MRKASLVYTRLGFFLGFSSASMAALYLICTLLDLPFDALWNGTAKQALPFGTRIIFWVGPLGAGLLAGFSCAAIAAGIGRKNARLESFLGSLWHYSSTGSIVWAVLSLFQFVITFGGPQAIKNYPAKKASLLMIGGGLVAGALICLMLRVAGKLLQVGYQGIGSHLLRFGPLVIGVATGVLQCVILRLSWWPGIIAGILFPYVLIPWAQSMCLRDELQ